MSRIAETVKAGYQDVDMNEEVTAFLRDTNLADVNLLSDSDLLSRLQSPRLLICHWDSTLSLAHPRLSVLLDDLDERLRRFVRYHHLDDKEYSKKEDQELAELEEEELQLRLSLRRSRSLYGECLLQGDEESEEAIQAKKQTRLNPIPPSTELVLAVLKLQAMLLSHCVKPHLFNSTDRLLSLLNADNPTLVSASLHVLFQLQSTSSRQLTWHSFQNRYVTGGLGGAHSSASSTMHIKTMLFTLANGVWGMREEDEEPTEMQTINKAKEKEKERDDTPQTKKTKKEHSNNTSPQKKSSKKKKSSAAAAAASSASSASASSVASSSSSAPASAAPAAAAAAAAVSTSHPTHPPTLAPFISPSSAPAMLSSTAKQIYSLLNDKSDAQVASDIRSMERRFSTAFVFPRVSTDQLDATRPDITAESNTDEYPTVLTLNFLSQLYHRHSAQFRSVSHFLSTLASPADALAAGLPCYAIPPKHLFTLCFVLRYLLQYPSTSARRKFFDIRLLSIQLLMTFSGQRKDVVTHVAHFDSLVVEGLIHIMRTDHVDMMPPSLYNTSTQYQHVVNIVPGVSFPTATKLAAHITAGAHTPHMIRASSILTLQALAASPTIRHELQQIGILQHGVLLTLVKQALANLKAFFVPPPGAQPPAVVDPGHPLWWLTPTDMHFASCQVIITDCFFNVVQRLIPKSPYEPTLLNHQEVIEIMVDTIKDKQIRSTSIIWRAVHIIDLCYQYSPSAMLPRLNTLNGPDAIVDRLCDLIAIRPMETSEQINTASESKDAMDIDDERVRTPAASSSSSPSSSAAASSAPVTAAAPCLIPPFSIFQVSPGYDFESDVTVKSLVVAALQARKNVIAKLLYLLTGVIRHDREPIRHAAFKSGKYSQLIKQIWTQSFDWSQRRKMEHADARSTDEVAEVVTPSVPTSTLATSTPSKSASEIASIASPDRKRKSALSSSSPISDPLVGSDDSLVSAQKRQKVDSQSIFWGEEIFVTACHLVIGLAQNNPACVKQLHSDGITATIVQCCEYDIIGPLTVQCLPETIRTMCLHAEARDLIIRNPLVSPLKDLIHTIFLSQHPRHQNAIDPHTITFAKNVEEFLRHYGRTALTTDTPSDTLTRDFMTFFAQMIDQLEQQGRALAKITALQATSSEWQHAPIIAGMQLRPESYSAFSRRLLSYSRFLEILFKNFGSNYLATTGENGETAQQLVQKQLLSFSHKLIQLALTRNLEPSLSGVFVGAKATEQLLNAAGEKLNSHAVTPSHSTMDAFSSTKHNAFIFTGFISPLIILSNKPDYAQTIYRMLLKRTSDLLHSCGTSTRLSGEYKFPHSYLRFVDRDRKMEVLPGEKLTPVMFRKNHPFALIDPQIEAEQDELLAYEMCQLSALSWCTHLFSRLTRRLPVFDFVNAVPPSDTPDSSASPAISFPEHVYLPVMAVLQRVQSAIAWDQINSLQLIREVDAFNAQVAREEEEHAAVIAADPTITPVPKRQFTTIRSQSSIPTDLFHSALSKFNQYAWKLLGSVLKVAKIAENAGGGASTVSKQNLADSKKLYAFIASGLVSLLSPPANSSPHRHGVPKAAFESTVWQLSAHLETRLFVCLYLKPVLKLLRHLLYMSTSLIPLSPSVAPHDLNVTLFAAIREAGGGEKLLKILRWTMLQRIELAQHMESPSPAAEHLNGSPIAVKEVMSAYDDVLVELGVFAEQLSRSDSQPEKPTPAAAPAATTSNTTNTPVATADAAAAPADANASASDIAARAAASAIPTPLSLYEADLVGSGSLDQKTQKFSTLFVKECWSHMDVDSDAAMSDSPPAARPLVFHSLQYLPPPFVSASFSILHRVLAIALKAEVAAVSKARAREAEAKAKAEREAAAAKEKAEKDAAAAAAAKEAAESSSASEVAAAAAPSEPITIPTNSPTLKPLSRPIRDVPLLSAMHESLISSLQGMGFSRVAAQASMVATQSTSPELNIEWLFAHPDEIAQAEADALATQQREEAQERIATQIKAVTKAALDAAAALKEKEKEKAAAAATAAEDKQTVWQRYFNSNDVLNVVISPILSSLSSLPHSAFSKDGLSAFPCMQPTPAAIGPDGPTTMVTLITNIVHFLVLVATGQNEAIPSTLGQQFRQTLVDKLIEATIHAGRTVDRLPLPAATSHSTATPSTPPTLTAGELNFHRAHALLYLLANYIHYDDSAVKDLAVGSLSSFLTDSIEQIRLWSLEGDYVAYMESCKSAVSAAKLKEEQAKEREKEGKKEEKKDADKPIPPLINPMHEAYVGSLHYVLNVLLLVAAESKDPPVDSTRSIPLYPLSSQESLLTLATQLIQTPLFQGKCLSSVCSIIAALTNHHPFIDRFIEAGGMGILLRLPTTPPTPTGELKSRAPTVASTFPQTPIYLLMQHLMASPAQHKSVIQSMLEALVCDLHRAMLRVRKQEADERAKELKAMSASGAAPSTLTIDVATPMAQQQVSPSPSSSHTASSAASSKGFLTPRVPFSPTAAGAVGHKSKLVPATPLPPLVFTPMKKNKNANSKPAESLQPIADRKPSKEKRHKYGRQGARLAAGAAAAVAAAAEAKAKALAELANLPPITPLVIDFHPLLHHVAILQLLSDELENQSYLLPLVWSFRPSQVSGVDCTFPSLVSLLSHQMVLDPLHQFSSMIGITDFALCLCQYQPPASRAANTEKKKVEKDASGKKKKNEASEENKEEEKMVDEDATATPSSSSAAAAGGPSSSSSRKKKSVSPVSPDLVPITGRLDPSVDPTLPPAPTTLEMTRVIIHEITAAIYMLIAKGKPTTVSHHAAHHTHIPRHASAILKAIHHHKQTTYLSMYTSDMACASLLHQKGDATSTSGAGTLHLALRSVLHTLIGFTNMLSVILSKAADPNISIQQHRRKIARIFVDGNTHAVLSGILAFMEWNAFSGTQLGVQLMESVTKLVETIVKLDAIYPLRAKENDHTHKKHRVGRRSKKHKNKRRRNLVLIDDGAGGIISVVGGSNRDREGNSYVVGDDEDLDAHQHGEEEHDEDMDPEDINRLFTQIHAEEEGDDDDDAHHHHDGDAIEEEDEEALIQNAVGGDQDELEEAAEEQAAEGDDDDDDEMMDLGEAGLDSDDSDDDIDDDDGDHDDGDDADEDGLGSSLDGSSIDDMTDEEDSDSDDDEDDEDESSSDEESISNDDSSSAHSHSHSDSSDEHSGNEDDAADAHAADGDGDGDDAGEEVIEGDLIDDDDDDIGHDEDDEDDEDIDDMDDEDMIEQDEFDDDEDGGGGYHVIMNPHRRRGSESGAQIAARLGLPLPPVGAMRPSTAAAFRRIVMSLQSPGAALPGMGEGDMVRGPGGSILINANRLPPDVLAQLNGGLGSTHSHAHPAEASSSPAPPAASDSAGDVGADVDVDVDVDVGDAASSSPVGPVVDEAFLMELPEEIRREILSQQGVRRGAPANGGSAQAAQDSLIAQFQFLDYDNQEDIISQQPDPEEFLFSLPSPVIADILYQRHLREVNSRHSVGGARGWRGLLNGFMQDYPEDDSHEEEKQPESKSNEEKKSSDDAADADEFDAEFDTSDAPIDPLAPYTHLNLKEVNDRSADSHPHPLLCPSLLVPIVRVLYMSPINNATNNSIFRIAHHVCVYQSTRHTLLSFVISLLRGMYTRAQTNDPMLKKMIDALPAGVLLGTKDDVTGTNLSTFSLSSNASQSVDRVLGLPPLLSRRLFDLLTHLATKRRFGTAKFFFSPQHLTMESEEAQEEQQAEANMQDLSAFSLQDAITASPNIKPANHTTHSKKDKHKKDKHKHQDSSPALVALPPAALSSSIPASPSAISPPPIIDLFALLGCSSVCHDRHHVRSLTRLLAEIVHLPSQLLADLRTYRTQQKEKKAAMEERKRKQTEKEAEDKKRSAESESTSMEVDDELASGKSASSTQSASKPEDNKSDKKSKKKSDATDEPKSATKTKKDKTPAATPTKHAHLALSGPVTHFPASLLVDDDDHIWSDSSYPYPLPPCPILPAWCFTFLFATLSLDGYPEKSLEAIMKIVLYFGERQKNRQLILTEIVDTIVKLSEGIQADMKTLIQLNATDAKPVAPDEDDADTTPTLSVADSGRKRKRSDASASASSSSSKGLDSPVSVSASTLMWSISQRESTLLRFVRILNTLSLIEPPAVTTGDDAKDDSPSTPAAAAAGAPATGDDKKKGSKKDDDLTNLTSLIKLPAFTATSGMVAPSTVSSNKQFLDSLGFHSHMHTLWSSMDTYFDIVEKRNTGFVVLAKPEDGEEAKPTGTDKKASKGAKDKEKEGAAAATATPKKDAAIEKAEKAAAEKAAALSKKLEDHRRDLTESESSDSSTTRESDLLLLMHLPLIEAYFIFFAPRTQPKIHNSVSVDDNRDQLAKDIMALEEAETPHNQDAILTALLPATTTAPSVTVGSALSSFYAFTFKHRRPLNVALRQHKTLLQTSMRSLLWHPSKILDFDIRRKYFKNEIKKMISKMKSTGGSSTGIKLQVRRDRIFEDSYQQLSRYTNKEDLLRSKLNIRFHGEEGLDAGGLAREFYLVLSRAIFNADNALFKPAADNPAVFQPNAESHINPDHLQFFYFAGRFVAKALMDNQRLDAYFTRSFYKHILSVAPSFPDVESVDPEKAKSLSWMLANSIDHILFETFSVESVEFGASQTIDLIPGGRDIQVTDHNKKLYVHLISEFILTRAIHKQLTSFLKGFHELIPAHLVSVFNEQELELMLCGLPDIDLADLKKNIEYRGFGSGPNGGESHLIDWFWQIISEFTQQEKALLVLFVTGTSKIPLEGFKALQGTNGITRFTLQKANGVDGLPLSHTCFNQLDIGDFTSIDVMREKLMMALREGSQGFGFR